MHHFLHPWNFFQERHTWRQVSRKVKPSPEPALGSNASVLQLPSIKSSCLFNRTCNNRKSHNFRIDILLQTPPLNYLKIKPLFPHSRIQKVEQQREESFRDYWISKSNISSTHTHTHTHSKTHSKTHINVLGRCSAGENMISAWKWRCSLRKQYKHTLLCLWECVCPCVGVGDSINNSTLLEIPYENTFKVCNNNSMFPDLPDFIGEIYLTVRREN